LKILTTIHNISKKTAVFINSLLFTEIENSFYIIIITIMNFTTRYDSLSIKIAY